MATSLVVVGVVIRFSKYQNFFILQPIVIKHRIQMVGNILYNGTVSDFQVKS